MKRLFAFICLSAWAMAARLIVLDPASAEILNGIGASSQIVGIAPPSQFDLRMDISRIASVGSYMKPNIESIYALQPDLILASRHSLASAEQLQKLGIKMRTMDASNFEQIAQNIKILGEITNKTAEANALADEFMQNIRALSDANGAGDAAGGAAGGIAGKSALVVFTAKPLMLFCGENLITSALSALGLVNICDSSEQTPIISTEYIATKRPDYLIYLGADSSELLKLPLMREISANASIISVHASSLLRGSQLIIKPLNELKTKLQQAK